MKSPVNQPEHAMDGTVLSEDANERIILRFASPSTPDTKMNRTRRSCADLASTPITTRSAAWVTNVCNIS
jgi:hypothetical protein